jgi:Flp pilus assembly pilin Flp
MAREKCGPDLTSARRCQKATASDRPETGVIRAAIAARAMSEPDGSTVAEVRMSHRSGRGEFPMSDQHIASRSECHMKLFTRFVREEAGQDLIEYGLLIGIITVGCITAISAIGPKVQAYFDDLNAALP